MIDICSGEWPVQFPVDVVEGGKVCVCVTLKKYFHSKLEMPKYLYT